MPEHDAGDPISEAIGDAIGRKALPGLQALLALRLRRRRYRGDGVPDMLVEMRDHINRQRDGLHQLPPPDPAARVAVAPDHRSTVGDRTSTESTVREHLQALAAAEAALAGVDLTRPDDPATVDADEHTDGLDEAGGHAGRSGSLHTEAARRATTVARPPAASTTPSRGTQPAPHTRVGSRRRSPSRRR